MVERGGSFHLAWQSGINMRKNQSDDHLIALFSGPRIFKIIVAVFFVLLALNVAMYAVPGFTQKIRNINNQIDRFIEAIPKRVTIVTIFLLCALTVKNLREHFGLGSASLSIVFAVLLFIAVPLSYSDHSVVSETSSHFVAFVFMASRFGPILWKLSNGI
jgi:phosphoglycerol transferase MdoB-like AlkP superfamily enzyme